MKDDHDNLALWLTILALSEQANRDWLTGLYNRRYFENTLSDHLAAASRYDRPLSLILFDIDNFKQINDEHGHQAGDDTLSRFAELLKTSARAADIVCRYGGDEFAVILPETDIEAANRFTNRIISEAEALGLSVSGGAAALPSNNLVVSADHALLATKRK